MRILDLGHQTTISPQWVKTKTTLGWVARIAGTHPEYELTREFLARETPENPELPRGWNWWRIPGNGLYEYRKLGDTTLQGFFTVDGTLRKQVRLIDARAAFAMAARMK